jgi:glycosyltransferase involved in cell wall biosynthesis
MSASFLRDGVDQVPCLGLPEGFTLLQVTPALEAGGVEQATLDLAAAVVRAGRRSLVATRGGRMESALEASGTQLVRLPSHSRNPLVMAANAARLAGIIRREKVSLVHVRSRAPAFSALSAARATGVPMVATYHGIYKANSGLKRWYNAIMTRGDVVIANSRYTAAHIAAEHGLAPGKIALVPEGVDTALFDRARVSPQRLAAVSAAWGISQRERRSIALLPARMSPLKGHGLIIEALAGLAAREGMLLIMAGAGGRSEYLLGLDAAAAVAGLGEQVRRVGPCDDMPAAYAAADLALAPSVAPESFGRTVVEAGAMGVPVIASAFGGPAETISDGVTGWLAAPGDAAAWGRALEGFLATDEEARAAMGRAARERVQCLYSLTAMCESTFEVYRRVLRGPA